VADIDSVLKDGAGRKRHVDSNERGAMLKACIERWAPQGSAYRVMSAKVEPFTADMTFMADPCSKLQGILRTLRRDYSHGMVKTFEEMVHASMFDDLLGQAQGLFDGGYLQAAVVVAGATLESHLRELAPRHQIAITDKKHNKTVARMASALNDDLHANAKAYTKTEFRQVQVWIDLRNEAAHGKPEFKNRTANDVGSMITGIREFMVRNPA